MGWRTDQAYVAAQRAGYRTWRASLSSWAYVARIWRRWAPSAVGVATGFATLGMLWLLAMPAHADDLTVNLGEKNPGVHFLYDHTLVKIKPAFEDYAYMLEDACDAMKLQGDDCMIYPMMGPIGGNAVATILDNNNRIIVYDRRLSSIVGSDGAEVIISHELGHHYCGHLGKPHSPQQELEADRFAGAAMKLMKRPLEATLAAVPLLDQRPSKTHRGRADRIAALKGGWEHPETAKACRK